MAMTNRDTATFIVGVILGGLGTYLDFIAAGWFGLPGMFVLCAFFFPLLASLLAEERTILAGLVPNGVMMVCLTVYSLVYLPSLDESFGWFEIIYMFIAMLAVGTFLALLVSVPIHLLRKRVRAHEPNHIFAGDAQQIVGREPR